MNSAQNMSQNGIVAEGSYLLGDELVLDILKACGAGTLKGQAVSIDCFTIFF